VEQNYVTVTLCVRFTLFQPTDPDGVGQGEGDGERQSFWNGDDQHGDADDEELEVLLQVLDAPRLVLDRERLDREAQDEDEHRQHRHNYA